MHTPITIIIPEDPIFAGINKQKVMLQKKHAFHVSEIPSSFECLATSDTCSNEIIRHKQKPIYGFISHPEVSGEDGMLMVKNFLKICKIID